MNNLGVLFANGQGVPQDYTKARAWFEKAAAKDFAPAMFKLGVIFDYGYGMPQDYAKAREWYERAAAQGDADAKMALEQLSGHQSGQHAPSAQPPNRNQPGARTHFHGAR
jgi:TPR repeat protein